MADRFCISHGASPRSSNVSSLTAAILVRVATATFIAVVFVRKNPDQVGFTLGVGSLSGSSR